MMRLNLGELIDTLKTKDPGDMVHFDFGGLYPSGVSSYRGYYEDFAIEFSDEGVAPQLKIF